MTSCGVDESLLRKGLISWLPEMLELTIHTYLLVTVFLASLVQRGPQGGGWRRCFEEGPVLIGSQVPGLFGFENLMVLGRATPAWVCEEFVMIVQGMYVVLKV